MPAQSTTRGEEPPMFLQRPSTGKSQDVRHILAKQFRELFTRDAVGPDTMKNLAVSKGGDDPYHERYVDALQKVFDERKRRMEEAAMLERHIMQAQARAMSADERELNKASQSCDNYGVLGLPPGRSNFRTCIDTELLKKHKLLTPSDYATEELPPVPPPLGPKVPSYARETMTSRQHTREDLYIHKDTPSPVEVQRSKSDLGGSVVSEGPLDQEKQKDEEFLAKFPRNDAWKYQLTEDQREQEKISLNRLQAMVNYTRNPRYVPPSAPGPGRRSLLKAEKPKPKEIGIQPKQDKLSEPQEHSQVFLVSPPAVVFSEYKVGQVYELTLTLKNVSSCIRQCRALPISTPYFSVGLGLFPGEHGLVAPGMSCHYAIRFAPDSLRDFDDEITIQTQSTIPIKVPLLGRRPPPKLSLPSVIDVGYCLVGGCHVTQLIVKNEGGTGRFCIMPSSAWPTTNFKSVVHNGNVPIPPFDVRPAVMEIGKNDTTVMDIVFQPPSVKSYSVEMCMVCDNCQVRHFTIKGEAQKAGVELVSVERGTTEPLPGELTDATAQHLVKFDSLNPFTYTDRSCVVKNLTNVSLPFQWMIYKPQFDSPGSDSISKKYDRVPDVDSVFSIHPPTGVLPPAETMEFKITYAPPIVDSFHSALHLLLNMVPPSVESISQGSSAGKEKNNSGEEKKSEEDDTVSEILLHQKDMAPFVDVTALEIEVKGQSTPLNVVLHPYAVHVPGKNLIGTTLKKMVTMANHSHSTITFQWEPYIEKYILEVEPPFGELDPGMAMDMELCITGPEPGKIDHTLYCHVMNLEDPLHLQVQAEFKGPEMSIDEPDLNFGLVRLGQTVSKEITVNNMSQIITAWSIQDCPAFAELEDDMALCEFTFDPAGGELKPLESKRVTVTFQPLTPRSVRRVIEVTVEDGKDCNISCFAEVQVAQVCLEHCELSIPEIYKNVPVVTSVKLINQTLLPTVFEWGQPLGDDSQDCKLELEPRQGTLKPREEKEITIQLASSRTGDFSDLRIPCKIEGLDTPLILAIFCDVKGLSVTYGVSDDGSSPQLTESPKLNFGDDVKLGSTPKLYLHIKNNSGITAQYHLSLENFFSKPPTPPGQKREEDGARPGSARRMLLGRTPNLADPLSKTVSKANADLCSAMLSQGKGASFVPVPAAGMLCAFTEEIIEITGFSDMWGQYTDNLVCKVGELEEVKIPIVSMTVIGCPLSFQMTASQSDLKPIVRFGSHVAGTQACKRTMRVNNTSPYDIRVDWETYNTYESDQKLTDLIVTFGKAFPLRDTDGNEIVPPSEASIPFVRQPTDFIPNSEDTSVAPSRELTEVATEGQEKLRPKIVSVTCRPHQGKKSVTPYSVKPLQMVIPAKGNANISLSFTPYPTEEVSEDIDCNGFMLGFMSFDNENARGQDGIVTRTQTFEAEQLRLDMTAHLKPALLTIECGDEEGMRYRSAMSSLLRENGGLKAESLMVNSVMLSNLTLTPLTFRLVTKQPFLLVDLDPSSNREGNSRAQATEMHTLKPRHNLVVKVAFQTTTNLLSEIASDYLNNEDDLSGGGRKIELKDNLVVEFNNTAKQLVPLHATLTVPQFTLSKESLDFGTCLVGQTRELQLMLSNLTSSHTAWSISQESKSETCAVDTFRVEPVSGLLEAHITHISDSKILLHVFFTAKHAEDYETVFAVHGILGETPRRLYIRGQGSYDEKHEAVLNV